VKENDYEEVAQGILIRRRWIDRKLRQFVEQHDTHVSDWTLIRTQINSARDEDTTGIRCVACGEEWQAPRNKFGLPI
jgi:hypothetical protein